MGSYAELPIDGYRILSTKSEVDPSIMTVFTEEDRLVRAPGDEESGRLPGPWVSARRPPPGEHGELQSFDCAYVASASVVRERLHVMGFTLPRAREVYEAGRAARLLEIREYQGRAEEPWWDDDIQALELLSFDAWLAAFRFVKERGVHALGKEERDMPPQLKGYYLDPADATPAVKFILEDEDSLMGWRIPDVRLFLRAALEACTGDVRVEQDVSDLIGGGYYEAETAIADEARAILTEGYPSNTRIVVLRSSPNLCVKRTHGEAPRSLHAALATTASFDVGRDMSR